MPKHLASSILVALLTLAAGPSALAQGPPPVTPPVEKPVEKPVDKPAEAEVVLWVLVAKGDGCSAGARTRKALDGFADKVERRVMSGAQATLVLKAGQSIDVAALRTALEANKLTLESFEQVKRTRAKAAYVLETPGLACAIEAGKAREALTRALGAKALAVHADTRTVIQLAKDEPLDTQAIEKALAALKVKHDAPKRDDSQIL